MSNPELSLCMIVKNEERNLRRCLDSAREIAGEIVIVDTGCEDATIEIAKQYGARIHSFDFTRVDFAGARNHSLRLAQGKWILVLDADEAVAESSCSIIREITAGSENAGFIINRRNRPQSNPDSYVTDYVLRLFPNKPEYRYKGRIHETVDDSILAGGGLIHRSEIVIDHFVPDLSEEQMRAKSRWYLGILLEEIAENPDDDSRLDFLAAEYFKLGMFDDAMKVAERIAALRPNDPEARGNLGIYYLLHKSDKKAARTELERSIELKPDYPESIFYLGIIDLEEGRIEKGLKRLEKAAALDPRLNGEAAEVFRNVGRTFKPQ